MNDLYSCAPSLKELFPEARSLEDKAFRFLDLHYECGGKIRRLARRLRETQPDCKIHHITVKRIVDFLLDTDVYIRFQNMIADQVEDFYSNSVLTELYEKYQKELRRADELIVKYTGRTKEEKAEKTKADHELALKWSRHKKSILDRIANISLVVRGNKSTGDSKDDPKNDDLAKKYSDVLQEAAEFEESTLDA